MTTIKPKKSTTFTTLISSVGIAAILGLSALLVVPSLQNQAFADREIRFSTAHQTITCSDGREKTLFDGIGFAAREQGGEWSGSLSLLETHESLRGLIDKGTLTPSGNFNLRGDVTIDDLCRGSPTPYNMHVTGKCGENVNIKFRTEDGEEGNWSGDVRCSSTN